MTAKGLNKAEIVLVLERQLITVAAMADASSLSIFSLSEPHVTDSQRIEIYLKKSKLYDDTGRYLLKSSVTSALNNLVFKLRFAIVNIDYEWKIGNRKQSAASSDDKDLERLAATYYVMNFPKHLTVHDLWKELEGYGRLVDVYIARKLSKQGKRFAFIPFLNVKDEQRLDYKLQSVWVGSFHLFISRTQFLREMPNRSLGKTNIEVVGRKDNIPMNANKVQGSSYANMVKGYKVDKQNDDQQSKIVLEVGEYQSVKHSYRIVLGEVNNATIIPQLIRMCYDEGFDDVKINSIGGLFGLKYKDDELEEHRSSGKICVCSKSQRPINKTRIVVVAGKEYEISVREIANWWPDIQQMEGVGSSSQVEEEDSDEVVESFDASDNEEEVPINEVIPNSFKAGKEEQNKHEPEVVMEGNVEENDTRKKSYDNLMKKVHEHEKDQDGQQSETSNHTFPPGFNDMRFQQSVASTKNISPTISFNIQETKMTTLDLFLVHSLWGNTQFKVASSGARGRSGGLVTVWDPNVFKRSRIWCIENAVIVEGEVVGCNLICYLVNVYAPQDRNRKLELWDYITRFITNHGGEFLVFGDFNTVRHKYERSEGYDQVVRDAWNEITQQKGDNIGTKQEYIGRLDELDAYMELNNATHQMVAERLDIMKHLADLEKKEGMDLCSKIEAEMGFRG
ncbi:RNA-directed DNA polymerase, eukaryota [Tanacetum coccineum]